MYEERNRMGLTRRSFLQTGATAAALLPLAGKSALAAGPYVRSNITSPEGQRAAASYAKAIQIMLTLPPDDPRNWYRQAMIHILDCPHGNWWFLPWHRGFLWYHETIVRELSGDSTFALPYWDWSATPSIVPTLWQGVLNPSNPAYLAGWTAFQAKYGAAVTAYWNTLNGFQRSFLYTRGYNSASALMSGIQSAFVNRANARNLTAQSPNLDGTTTYLTSPGYLTGSVLAPLQFESGGTRSGFGSYRAANHEQSTGKGPLESGPHDNVHGNISGFMGDFMSPVDPIFFMHHGNIDRIWTIWTAAQEASGFPTLPTEASWGQELFLFYFDTRKQPVSSNAGQWTAPRDYSYTAGTGAGYRHPQRAAGRNLIAGSTLTTPQIGTAAALAGRALVSLPESLVPRAVNVTVSVPSNQKLAPVLVFVNAPDLAGNPTSSNPGFIGSVSPFGLGHGHDSGKVTLQLPIPDSLIAAGLVKAGGELNVQLISTGPSTSTHALHGVAAPSATPEVSQVLEVQAVL